MELSYTYDSVNRLAGVTDENDNSITYEYDENGNLINKNVYGQTPNAQGVHFYEFSNLLRKTNIITTNSIYKFIDIVIIHAILKA